MNSDRQEEAIALLRLSLESDPLRPGAYISLAMSLIAANRFEEAEAVCRKGIEIAPQYAAMRSELALALLGQGSGEEARAEATQEVHPGFRLWALVMIDHVLGKKAESDEELKELIEKGAEDGAFQIAEVLAVRGESDAAFEWLERAYAQRDGGLAETKSSPRLRSLHGDARWNGFLRKMGFET
jgi:tetratricopeptide (TPR) repeat protein